MNNKNKMLIFVYGTLVRGGRLHRNMDGAEYMGDYILDGYGLYNVGGRYPAIVPEKGERTYGEVFAVSNEDIRRLDLIEGDDYHRLTVTATNIATSEELKCRAYIYIRPVEGYDKVQENTWANKYVKVLGYGSLMNSADFLKMYSPDEQELMHKAGNGILPDYRLAFTYDSTGRNGGVLDVIKGALDDYVIGVVYEMPYWLLIREIDEREANGRLYQRELVQITINGMPDAAYCYFLLDHRRDYNGVAPHENYNQLVLAGMHENNFPKEYIDKYIDYVISLKR